MNKEEYLKEWDLLLPKPEYITELIAVKRNGKSYFQFKYKDIFVNMITTEQIIDYEKFRSVILKFTYEVLPVIPDDLLQIHADFLSKVFSNNDLQDVNKDIIESKDAVRVLFKKWLKTQSVQHSLINPASKEYLPYAKERPERIAQGLPCLFEGMIKRRGGIYICFKGKAFRKFLYSKGCYDFNMNTITNLSDEFKINQSGIRVIDKTIIVLYTLYDAMFFSEDE